MAIRIEYCRVWNYEPRALRARDRLKALGAENVEIAPGAAGAFEIAIDGRTVSSKLGTGRFPTDAEVDALLGW